MNRFAKIALGENHLVVRALVTAVLLVLAVPTTAVAAATEVLIDSGRLAGDMSPHDGEIAVFKGIPFAAPPDGAQQ